MTDARIFVVHHYDDCLKELMPSAYEAPYVHIDMRGVAGNENFNEAAALASPLTQCSPETKFSGLCHYRRLLRLPNSLDENTIYFGESHYSRVPVRDEYNVYHSKELLDKFMQKASRSSWGQLLEEWLSTNHMYSRNLFLMPRDAFLRWQSFTSGCMLMIRECMEQMKSSDIWSNVYDKRSPGALCERLSSFFVQKLAGKSLKQAEVISLSIPSDCQRDEASTMRLRDNIMKYQRGEL